MGIAVKFGITTTLVVLETVNFTWLRLVKFIPISNTTLVIFIPNFTATHVIPSIYACCALKKIAITTFSLLPVKYGINFTATIETFVWAVKQVWY